MCGVVGTISERAAPVEGRIDALHHRGPDGRGHRDVDVGWARVQLGGTRLSIVDLRDLPVPAQFDYLGVCLSFNGEIYNWRELREELSDGLPWQTNCDTEVVARAWRRWGPAMLHRFNGMFACALVDSLEHKVFLARDRAGEKPLLYRVYEGHLHFASEVKGLPGPFHEEPCTESSVLEFDCLRDTPFRGVYRLEPGHQLLLECAEDFLRPTPTQWWGFPTEVDDGMTWEDAVNQTEELLVNSIRIRAITEVPTAALVSGGLDSAIVQAVAKCPRVYCCSFPDDGMDWLELASLGARGAEVVPVTFDLQMAEEALPSIAYHLDTPATWTALAHWFLARRMAQDNVKVVLAGEGADELFAGYTRYRALWWVHQARLDPQLANYQKVIGLITSGSQGEVLAKLLDRSSNGHARTRARELVDAFSTTNDPVADMCRVEWHTTMQCLLRMADRMCAAHSIENRAPFLDYRLIELAARMPTRHKVSPLWSKHVLREVAQRVGVHQDIIEDKNKRGLVVPWNMWRKVPSDGPRGPWDRADFASAMSSAWRGAFGLEMS